ncbi:hypothetical protein AB0J55_19525 [Amycolatopsis sp. NPDC049688]|uniref:hypothetical protein n=1 Tax=Amycolatopsis sp. NPDC049688 TaxID=3154733 RepID=UPI00343B8176
MTVQLDFARTDQAASPAAVEAALRWLATRKEGEPLRFLRYAIEEPASESAAAVGCLAGPTASLPGGTPESRALAIWGLIVEEVAKAGSAEDSRRRNTLKAAFRLPPAPGPAAVWKGTLDDRFKQLTALDGVFGSPPPSTTTPMHKAWRRAVALLADCLTREFGRLQRDGTGWQVHVEAGRAAAAAGPGGRVPGLRPPSRGAQPVFLERMLVRVVMGRRTVSRRLTERTLVACGDGVDGYDVHALTGRAGDLAGIPVQAIWNCRLVAVPGPHPGDPVMARLRFRRKLRQGESYSLVSEATDDRLDQQREWVNVEVDHHGIAVGERNRAGEPVAGLTIQVTFDEGCLPEACWWYAEQTEHERLRRPPAGDPHLLVVEDGFVQHTFAGPCQPREEYGIAFRWPQECSRPSHTGAWLGSSGG